jgi:hypothetical protein
LQGGFPKRGSRTEYSFYFEKCFPSRDDRKHYIQALTSGINPSLGHKCLGALIESTHVNSVWTTNFDELIESGIKSINPALPLVVISPDNSHHAESKSNYPIVNKLHGDYRYDSLQNTIAELGELVVGLHNSFGMSAREMGLIVIGYGGNDTSILKAFNDALLHIKPFPMGLYWCIRKGSIPNDDICAIVAEANKKNSNSGFVEVDGFDELLYDLYATCQINNSQIEGIASNLFEKRKPFYALQAESTFAPLKLNALKVYSFPKTCYRCKTTLDGWDSLRNRIANRNIVAALSRGFLYAFGDLSEIADAFSGTIDGEIGATDIEEKFLYRDNSASLSLFYDLIENSLTRVYGLIKAKNQGNRTYYSPHLPLSSNELYKAKANSGIKIFESINLQLQYIDGALFIVLLPSVHICNLEDEDKRKALSNAIQSNRYNAVYNDKLKLWVEYLHSKSNPMQFTPDIFSIKVLPSLCFAGYQRGDTHFFQGSFKLEEPNLCFHFADQNFKCVHPLKGLVRYAPLDKSFETRIMINSNIRIAIIAPEDFHSRIRNYLAALGSSSKPQSEKEYIVDYESFSSIYKTYLEIPDSADHILCQIIRRKDVSAMGQIEFYEHLKRKIDYFYTLRGDFDILVIYIPREWSGYRELKNDDYQFDLHDSLKLYCAKKNIKIQMIEDKSIEYFDACRVKWWLSLGLYVKGNGTPWMSSVLSPETAFVGLGFSVDIKNGKCSVVLGSSQLFDSTGQGMRFLLQPISNAIVRGKNASMSKEDARRFVLKLKEAYFRIGSTEKLSKIVIHKTTYFTKEEIEGISQALDGIENVELLQIQQTCNWRGIRGAEGKKAPHLFPVERGTVVQLDKFSFLLWTHGSVVHNDIADGRLNYYKGKRGIPHPLFIRRFRGTDDIRKVALDILALTKMNWNTAEMYRILPATLDFSKTLSRMAKQTESLQNIPYDFRLFI